MYHLNQYMEYWHYLCHQRGPRSRAGGASSHRLGHQAPEDCPYPEGTNSEDRPQRNPDLNEIAEAPPNNQLQD